MLTTYYGSAFEKQIVDINERELDVNLGITLDGEDVNNGLAVGGSRIPEKGRDFALGQRFGINGTMDQVDSLYKTLDLSDADAPDLVEIIGEIRPLTSHLGGYGTLFAYVDYADPTGASKRYAIQADGRWTDITNNPGSYLAYSYDGSNKPVSLAQRIPFTIAATLDGNNTPTGGIPANGTLATFTADTHGNESGQLTGLKQGTILAHFGYQTLSGEIVKNKTPIDATIVSKTLGWDTAVQGSLSCLRYPQYPTTPNWSRANAGDYYTQFNATYDDVVNIWSTPEL
jgi:hypothetical protein